METWETESASLRISEWHVANGHPELQNKRRNPFKPHISWSSEECCWCYSLPNFSDFDEEAQLEDYCLDQTFRWCPV